MASGLDQWLGKLEGHNEIGEALTKQLQKAEEEVQQFVGGRMALKAAAEKVGALGAIVQEDLKAGKLSFESELKASEYVTRMVIRAREVILNMADGSQNREIAASGKVTALKESHDLVLRHCKTSLARAEQLRAAKAEAEEALKAAQEGAEPAPEEPGEAEGTRGRGRSPGERPVGSTLDERRKQAMVDQLKAESNREAEMVKMMDAGPEPKAEEAKPPEASKSKPTRKKPGPKPGTKRKTTKTVKKE